MNGRLGWLRDPPKLAGQAPDWDANFLLNASAPIPPSGSVKHYVVELLNQGPLGSCVANAISQAVRISHVRQGMARPALASRLLMYYCSRAENGDTSEDSGSYLRSCFGAMNKFGFCPESAWPYDVTKYARMPASNAFRMAFDQHSPTVYQRISSQGTQRTDDIKRAITAGYAVAFGTSVSNRFTQGELGRGPIPAPTAEPIAGGHALCCVGYDGDAFEIVNSWGEDFGANGYCWFSGDYMRWYDTSDLWIVNSAPRFSE